VVCLYFEKKFINIAMGNHTMDLLCPERDSHQCIVIRAENDTKAFLSWVPDLSNQDRQALLFCQFEELQGSLKSDELAWH
jgi:hypothetical protein